MHSPEHPDTRLLAELVDMPAAKTVIWVPRRLKSRYGRIVAALIHDTVDAAMRGNPEAARADKHRLVWLSTSLLLRSPEKKTRVGVFRDDKPRGFSTVEVLRRRMVLAEAGSWGTLVAEYHREEAARPTRHTRQE